ncbi:hypothetical protein B0H10DRAFT_2011461 [Mycena sp. CBHHK59/15]|nr:hypothetical protein B0H10DRAFT_2011461 [Mycena sp. CBHHK59/15]
MTDTISSALRLGHSHTTTFEQQAKRLIEESEAKIARIESQIKDLECMRDQLLREIFVLVAWGGRFQDVPKAILRLGQVCAHWRRLAHSTPQLWTTLPRVECTKKKRSDACHDYHKCADAALLMGVFDSAGTLRELEEVDMTSRVKESCERVDAFLCAPRLRRVTLNVKQIALFPMPWGQLTHIDLGTLSSRACIRILAQCTSVVSAKLHIAEEEEEEDEPDVQAPVSGITLPQLTNLDLDVSGMSAGEPLIPIFQSLKLPALQVMNLHLDTKHELTFNWPTAPLDSILQHAPLLRSLVLDCCWQCVDDDFFDALCYRETDPMPLAPRLEVLNLSGVGCDFHESSLSDMIGSRWWSDAELLAMPTPPAVARLRDVDYWGGHEDGEFCKAFQRNMRAMAAQGLKVEAKK